MIDLNSLIMSNTDKQLQQARPPVVVILGHVDHGKTSLLDLIRKTRVAEKESGGITQHIGAYQTEIKGKLITFLDAPGHEAFAAIRSRGIKVADVAVLVVAADEGVKPQTKEAIGIIKQERIPLVVAANKIDKEGANIQKVKQELAAEDILVEDWGGKVPIAEISVKQNKNIDELLDLILLVAELEDLKQDLSPPAEGVIIESNLDKRRGYVATALVKKGKLKVGDWIVAGNIMGKIKLMENFIGKSISEAGPSKPVQIVGWTDPPTIGKEFVTAYSKDKAVGLCRGDANPSPLFQSFTKSSSSVGDGVKILKIIVKSDVSSSLEAIEATLGFIKSEEVICNVISYGIGNISDSDVKLATGNGSIIIGFRVGIDDSVRRLAEKDKVQLSLFDVIYSLVEYIRKEMTDLLDPEVRKTSSGKIKILAIFKKDSKSQIIGGKVLSGKIIRGGLVDVLRNNNKLLSGKITQLQHGKQDVSEVKEGSECGLKFESLIGQPTWDIKEGDVLEVYEEEKIARNL